MTGKPSKFAHLKAYAIDQTSEADCTLYQIDVNGKSPTLRVRPATEANKPYFSALLKRNSKLAAQLEAKKITPALIEETRDTDRELYAKFVVIGWHDMVQPDGKDIPFTPEDCVEFLEELPDWLFDLTREFCRENTNFAGGTGDAAAVGNG